jgi:hypothetical protein
VAARRALTLALPPSDERSAVIWAHLEGLGGEVDQSAELRRLICEALEQGPRLARIEAMLAQALAGGGASPPPMDAATRAAIEGDVGQWEG